MIIKPELLRAEAFAPFGDVLEAPPGAGRNFFGDGLANRRPGAAPSLAVAVVPPLVLLPLTATRMERHEFSSQSFLALDVARWLVIIAPKGGNGRPDTAPARAFPAGAWAGRPLAGRYVAPSAHRARPPRALRRAHLARAQPNR